MGSYSLLNVGSDGKTPKGEKRGYLTGILYLAPHTVSGYNVCPKAGDCAKWCLNLSGRGRGSTAQNARIRRVKQMMENPDEFYADLKKDVRTLIRESDRRDLTPLLRPNGTSDLPKVAHILAKEFPDLQLYDYTKIPNPAKRTLPNYHLTFSYDTYGGVKDNWKDCLVALESGINVAVVFKGEKPKEWRGFPVINGDEDDIRPLDPTPSIVALSHKTTTIIEGREGFLV